MPFGEQATFRFLFLREDLKTGFYQILCHWIAHIPEADPT